LKKAAIEYVVTGTEAYHELWDSAPSELAAVTTEDVMATAILIMPQQLPHPIDIIHILLN
jgi:hypothetical protein